MTKSFKFPESEEEVRNLSAGEMIAMEALGVGKTRAESQAMVQRTFRLYPHISFDIDAFAQNMGWTRNETVNRLISAGVDSVRDAIRDHDPEKAVKLFTLKGHEAFSSAMADE